MSHIAYVNGRYVPHKSARVSIEDRGYQFADGVYEVIFFWKGVPVDYGPHMTRLARSLSELRMASPMPFAALTTIIKEVAARNRLTNGIVYIQINRGVAPRAHPFPSAIVRPTIVVTAKHLPPRSDATAEQGVKVITAPDIRWGRVDIKSVGLLPNTLARQAAAEQKAYEALLYIDGGVITEASASNAWLVTKDQAIVTHPATNDILSGITRGTVMKLARDAGYTINERPFTLAEIADAKEIFLTGSTTFVTPVVQVDDRPVANGAAGTVALDLRKRYRAYVEGIDVGKAWAS